MYMRSWREANFIKNTHRAGARFEENVVETLRHYTNAVWRNVRIETLLTQTGDTELDIVFYYGGLVYILELKRVRRIVGSYRDHRWKLYQWHGRTDDLDEYVTLNVIQQNNIHARSFCDLYYSEFRCFPKVVPLVIVPDDCEIPDELHVDIRTIGELQDLLQTAQDSGAQRVPYRIAYLMNGHTETVPRKDLVVRFYRDGQPVRGKPI